MEAAHVSIYSTAPPVSRMDLRQQDSLSIDTPQNLVTMPEPGGALLRALARFNQQKRVGQRWLCTGGNGGATVVSFGGVSRERQVGTGGLWPHPSGLSLNVDCRQQSLQLSLTSSFPQHLFSGDWLPSPAFL